MSKACPECGAYLSETALGTLCPRCLIGFGKQAADRDGDAARDSLIGLAAAEIAGNPSTMAGSDSGAPAPLDFEADDGDAVDNYRILGLLGEGGFAKVYLAEQLRPIRRHTALKVLKPAVDTDQVVQRFQAETQVLAMMNHAHIVQVFDAGMVDGGRPYFAMEWVQGSPINTFCAEEPLPSMLDLFATVCEAMQHAHDQGIIHRDLKPSNILVSRQAGQAVPKIIDFGIAKAVDRPLTGETLYTKFYHFVGSPDYMSPEQFDVGSTIDVRSDVYALGCLLFELLTGQSPLRSEKLEALPLAEAISRIRKQPHIPPSQLLDQDGDRQLACRRGLDQIVGRALEKDVDQRFQSASEVASAIRRFLATGRFREFRWPRLPISFGITMTLIAIGAVALAASMAVWPLIQNSDTASNAPGRPVSATSTWRPPYSGKASVRPVALYQLAGDFESALPDGVPLWLAGDPSYEFLEEPAPGNDENRSFLRLPAFQPNQWLAMANPIPPNGSDPEKAYQWTNAYSMVLDVRYEALDGASGLFQAQIENKNDAEASVGASGISFEKSGARGQGIFTTNEWHRIVLVLDDDGSFVVASSYIDGISLGRPNSLGANASIDGRFGLEDVVLFFADSQSKLAPVDVSSIALFDYPLSHEEIQLLGEASPGGIPESIPIPSHFLQPAALFQFDGNLNNAIREEAAAVPPRNLPLQFDSPLIAGQRATAVYVPALRPGELFSIPNPLPSNGPDKLIAQLESTNFFTVAMDVCFPSLATPISLLSFSPASEGHLFVLPDGRLCDPGYGFKHNAGGEIMEDRWHRIVFVADGTQSLPYTACYIDGTRALGDLKQGFFDGYHVLEQESVFPLASSLSLTGNAYINSFAIYEEPLTADQIALLGSPTADGLPMYLGLDQPSPDHAERMLAYDKASRIGQPLAVTATGGDQWAFLIDPWGEVEAWKRSANISDWEEVETGHLSGPYAAVVGCPSSDQDAGTGPRIFGFTAAHDIQLIQVVAPNAGQRDPKAQSLGLPPKPTVQFSTAIDGSGVLYALTKQPGSQWCLASLPAKAEEWRHQWLDLPIKRAELHWHPTEERFYIVGVDESGIGCVLASNSSYPNMRFDRFDCPPLSAFNDPLVNLHAMLRDDLGWEFTALSREGFLEHSLWDPSNPSQRPSITSLSDDKLWKWFRLEKAPNGQTIVFAESWKDHLFVRQLDHSESRFGPWHSFGRDHRHGSAAGPLASTRTGEWSMIHWRAGDRRIELVQHILSGEMPLRWTTNNITHHPNEAVPLNDRLDW